MKELKVTIAITKKNGNEGYMYVLVIILSSISIWEEAALP